MTQAPEVLVTGMGVVSSIGGDLDEFARSLAEGRSGIGPIRRAMSPPLPFAPIAAELADFSLETSLRQCPGLPKPLADAALSTARRAPLAVQASVVAAVQAWRQARLDGAPLDPERVGLVAAGHNSTQAYKYGLVPGFLEHPQYLSPRYALQAMDSNQIGVLSRILDIRGEGMVVGAASASGNAGIIQGMRMVRAGVVDACLVVGMLAELSPMELQGFHNIGALGGKRFGDAPAQACRPFDAGHEGFIPGQASACLVLESAASATARGVSGLAALLGGASVLHASASSDPDRDGEARAMAGALRQAGLAPADIDYVNAHGTSSPQGDEVEIAAMEAVFGRHFPEVWINATKGLVGHCLYSAGVVEMVATIAQMHGGFLHPNLNLAAPIHDRARFCGPSREQVQVRTALSNGFGFGGINTSVAVRKCG